MVVVRIILFIRIVGIPCNLGVVWIVWVICVVWCVGWGEPLEPEVTRSIVKHRQINLIDCAKLKICFVAATGGWTDIDTHDMCGLV